MNALWRVWCRGCMWRKEGTEVLSLVADFEEHATMCPGTTPRSIA